MNKNDKRGRKQLPAWKPVSASAVALIAAMLFGPGLLSIRQSSSEQVAPMEQIASALPGDQAVQDAGSVALTNGYTAEGEAQLRANGFEPSRRYGMKVTKSGSVVTNGPGAVGN